MITPRTTRLVRVPDLQAFREAVVFLACGGAPLDARDRLVVVPTRAAAAHLLRAIEDRTLGEGRAILLPDVITPGEIVDRLAERLPAARRPLTDAEREVLLGVASRAAREGGAEPPFRLRPGLVAEMLRFYDALRLNQKDVDAFERLALGLLEPGASYDRGAERLVRQTRFLVAAFRAFEDRCREAGVDAHQLRDELMATPAARPVRHVVLTVTDRAFDVHGLTSADWDLLARLPGLDRLDVVVTDTVLAGGLHERVHRLLPGIEEIRVAGAQPPPPPVLLTGPGGSVLHAARDREEEVADFARRVKQAMRTGAVSSLERIALVVRQPLPYVYVAREVLRAGGIPCQLFDALPLASEPFAAAVDLVLSCVSAAFARTPAIALLRSPHFQFAADGNVEGSEANPAQQGNGSEAAGTHGPAVADPATLPGGDAHQLRPLRPGDIAALDRLLGESGYSGGIEALERVVSSCRGAEDGRARRALGAADALLQLAREIEPLRSQAPASAHLALLHRVLVAHERLPAVSDPLRARHLRARAAVLGTIQTLRDAYDRFDHEPAAFEDVAALLRRWIEGQTFAPRTGESGVHLVDAGSAPFGSFDFVQVAGLVEGEWPEGPRRNIFYSPAILRELGWPAEAERIAGIRAAFADLLRLPAHRLIVSAFTLEADALVTPSPLLDEVERAGLGTIEEDLAPFRIFDYEALGSDPMDAHPLGAFARTWLARRLARPAAADPRFRGITAPPPAAAYSLSALERYQDCPFKFFAADILRLEEAPEDRSMLTPRARGRFVHEVFERFFSAWDREAGKRGRPEAGKRSAPEKGGGAAGRRAITSDRLDEARALFARVAEPLLEKLPQPDAALERTRLFGSAISLGIADVVLGLEASRPVDVRERWLEYRLDGEFALGGADGRRVALRGVADRIDLLAGGRLRVIDYKSGAAPNPRRALQVPIYGLCAQERLAERDGTSWAVDEASYVAFSGRRPLVPIVKPGGDVDGTLAAARSRLLAAVDGIGRGEFPPRPHDPMICRYCAYAPVCRKDYVGDD